MENHELQRLRDLPIEGVAGRLGLQVNRQHKCLCPFHGDRHPSLSFLTRKNTFRCFACDAHGGTIDLVMRFLRKDFKEACRWLADEHNVILDVWKPPTARAATNAFDASRYERFFDEPWLSDEARRFLFGERRLNPAVTSWLRITSYYGQGGIPWLQTPYYDTEGKLIGVQDRRLSPLQPQPHSHPPLRGEDTGANADGTGKSPFKGDPEALPRFRFPSGSHCSIYNLPMLNYLKAGDELWITEGCSDCWAMLSSGRKAIAIPSATLLSPKDKELLSALNSGSRTCGFHMYPDRDVPGERLFLQLKEVLPGLVHHQLPKDCKDFSDYYVKLKPAADNGQQR